MLVAVYFFSMKQLNVVLTETEAELLLLAIIEIKEKWDASPNGEMKSEHHREIGNNYASIIDKVRVEYEK